MKTVTFDTTSKPTDPEVKGAANAGWDVAFATVTERETENADFNVELRKYNKVSELAVWDESSWDGARWADDDSSNILESILSVISNGGFPKNRKELTKGQIHQLRDAMILEAHANAKRDLFVTGDVKAFINNSNREQLEGLLNTRIISIKEFESELNEQNKSV